MHTYTHTLIKSTQGAIGTLALSAALGFPTLKHTHSPLPSVMTPKDIIVFIGLGLGLGFRAGIRARSNTIKVASFL